MKFLKQWNYRRYRKLVGAVATSFTGIGLIVGTDLDHVGVGITTIGNALAVFFFPNEGAETTSPGTQAST